LNKFGVEQEVVASILSPDAVIEGQPEVERHYYSDSGETTALLPIGSDRVWMGGAQPGSVALVGSGWEPLAEIQMDEEAILALAEGPEGSVYAGGEPGGKVWLCNPDGSKKLFYETGAERVASLLSFSDGTLAVGTGSPGRLIHLDAEGNVIEEWKIGEPESVLSLTLGEEGELLAGTARPAQLISIASDKQPEVLLESEDEQIEQVQVDEDGTIWFVSGGAKPSKLQKLADGQVELIWDSPKKPIRGFLIYPEGVVVVSTGNVGSMYLIRG
ncbi:MAG: hypothetical protein KC964_11520, partial [Candidatus Omnitrophica bacterium]|nr:hypothetical protein [Candidatus Omnitrophota bacterium]